MIDINHFEKESEYIYKDEHYLVQDNDAVMRRSRDGKRPHPTDNQWTFGKSNIVCQHNQTTRQKQTLKTTDYMKIFFLTLTFALTTMLTFAQSTSQPPIQNISADSTVVYRLFATNNTYNFIKLNTRNGQMWQVQWSLKDNQFETTLSDISRVTKEEERNGRFFLYPTTNSYNFILLDQIDGRAWQVQWNFEAEKRMVVRIY